MSINIKELYIEYSTTEKFIKNITYHMYYKLML